MNFSFYTIKTRNNLEKWFMFSVLVNQSVIKLVTRKYARDIFYSTQYCSIKSYWSRVYFSFVVIAILSEISKRHVVISTL